MADTQPPRVDNEIVQMWRRDGRLYAIAGFIAGVMLFPLLASLSENLAGFLQQLVPEGVGIVITLVFINRIIQRRDERNAETALKQQLVRDARSPSNEVATNAMHQIRARGWLEGDNGLLIGANLSEANLKGVDLRNANLQGANLFLANLQEAKMWKANLRGATLEHAQLQKSDLTSAQLQRANFSEAELRGAILIAANLQEANLLLAKLQAADLTVANLQNVRWGWNARPHGLDNVFRAELNEWTTLPNGGKWTEEIDLKRFTDPSHPDFDHSWEETVKEYWDFMM